MAKALTREQELRKAIEKADLPARDYRIFQALLARAKWVSAEIDERYQPRGLAELAAWCHMSKSNLCLGLSSLEATGWIKRARFAKPGRGHFTAYQLSIGTCQEVSKPGTHSPQEVSKKTAVKCPDHLDVSAGQGPVCAKGVREEEEVERRVLPQVPRLPVDSFWVQAMWKLYDEER